MGGFFSDTGDQLCSALAVTDSAVVSTDQRDLGPVADNALRTFPGPRPLYVEIYVPEAVTRTAGAANVTFDVLTDSVTTLDSSATTHVSLTMAKADLTLGSFHYLELPKDATYERYLGVKFTPSATLDTGKFTARITPDRVVGNVLTYADRVVRNK
jgi:hypothetical protein